MSKHDSDFEAVYARAVRRIRELRCAADDEEAGVRKYEERLIHIKFEIGRLVDTVLSAPPSSERRSELIFGALSRAESPLSAPELALLVETESRQAHSALQFLMEQKRVVRVAPGRFSTRDGALRLGLMDTASAPDPRKARVVATAGLRKRLAQDTGISDTEIGYCRRFFNLPAFERDEVKMKAWVAELEACSWRYIVRCLLTQPESVQLMQSERVQREASEHSESKQSVSSRIVPASPDLLIPEWALNLNSKAHLPADHPDVRRRVNRPCRCPHCKRFVPLVALREKAVARNKRAESAPTPPAQSLPTPAET